MATDYTALIAKWATLTPGTTAQKISQINAINVTGSVPTSFYTTGDAILNCINYTEFKLLSAQEQSNLMANVLQVPGRLLGGSGQTTHMVSGMIIDLFLTLHAGPNTIAALTALAQATVVPWWQASVANGGGGLTSPITQADTDKAGLV